MSYLKGHIRAIAEEAREVDDDARLIADMIEGCTDAYDRIVRLIQAADEIKASAEAVKALAAQYNERSSVLSTRAKAMEEAAKAIAGDIMDETGEPVKTPLCTISRRNVSPKIIVQDVNMLPDRYCRIERKPDMAAIRAADAPPLGTAWDNGGVTYSIRRK